MLKHLPKNALKKIEKTMLYSKQPIYFNRTTLKRRTFNSATANDITNLNINERIAKFQNQLKNEFVYRIPLRYFTDIGKINFPLKIDFRIKCHLEIDMKKLFESKKKSNSNRCTRRKNYIYKGTVSSVRTIFGR